MKKLIGFAFGVDKTRADVIRKYIKDDKTFIYILKKKEYDEKTIERKLRSLKSSKKNIDRIFRDINDMSWLTKEVIQSVTIWENDKLDALIEYSKEAREYFKDKYGVWKIIMKYTSDYNEYFSNKME